MGSAKGFCSARGDHTSMGPQACSSVAAKGGTSVRAKLAHAQRAQRAAAAWESSTLLPLSMASFSGSSSGSSTEPSANSCMSTAIDHVCSMHCNRYARRGA